MQRRNFNGHKANHVMKTDIKEMNNGYELIVDLPGFKKDEVHAALGKWLSDHQMQRKAWIKTRKKKRQDVISAENVMQVPAVVASM